MLFEAVVADPEGAKGCAAGAARSEDGAAVEPEGVELAGAEQQFGTTGLGAETPAMSEPSPSFCSVGASSFPVESRPLADWNFSVAAIVSESHLPFGSPL